MMLLTLPLASLVCGSLAARTRYFPRSKEGNGFVHIPMEPARREVSQVRSRDTINATVLNEEWLYVVEGKLIQISCQNGASLY